MLRSQTSIFFVTNNDSKDQIVVIEPFVHVYRVFPGETVEVKSTYRGEDSIQDLAFFELVLKNRCIILFPYSNVEITILRNGNIIEPFSDGFPDDFKEIY